MTAQSIIRDICLRFAVDADELAGRARTMRGPVGSARAEAIRQLRSSGQSIFQVASLLDTDGATIAFYGKVNA